MVSREEIERVFGKDSCENDGPESFDSISKESLDQRSAPRPIG
jgi:hypothetical protein